MLCKDLYLFISILFLSILLKIKFTNVSRGGPTVPVIPVPDKESEDVLILQEGQAVLTVVVIGLVSHPVVPGNKHCSWSLCIHAHVKHLDRGDIE